MYSSPKAPSTPPPSYMNDSPRGVTTRKSLASDVNSSDIESSPTVESAPRSIARKSLPPTATAPSASILDAPRVTQKKSQSFTSAMFSQPKVYIDSSPKSLLKQIDSNMRKTYNVNDLPSYTDQLDKQPAERDVSSDNDSTPDSSAPSIIAAMQSSLQLGETEGGGVKKKKKKKSKQRGGEDSSRESSRHTQFPSVHSPTGGGEIVDQSIERERVKRREAHVMKQQLIETRRQERETALQVELAKLEHLRSRAVFSDPSREAMLRKAIVDIDAEQDPMLKRFQQQLSQQHQQHLDKLNQQQSQQQSQQKSQQQPQQQPQQQQQMHTQQQMHMQQQQQGQGQQQQQQQGSDSRTSSNSDGQEEDDSWRTLLSYAPKIPSEREGASDVSDDSDETASKREVERVVAE